MESLASGTLAGTGSFRCDVCGQVLTMTTEDVLPQCPSCHGASFTRTSLFGTARFKRAVPTESDVVERDALIAEALDDLDEPGRYLVFQDGGTMRTMALTADSMRIGRSLSADLRFEDPTVSRRHAVLVGEPDGVRVLDDRSLNGVFVNGKRVSSHALSDGDEILIGRYRLRFVDVLGASATAGAEVLRAE
ncbi:MAG: FHA domain-containing protein [Solirubrobacteraceae bacterium]